MEITPAKLCKMRIYFRDLDGTVDYSSFETVLVNPYGPFPLGSSLTGRDYAIELGNGDLCWLNSVMVIREKEYCCFSGCETIEGKGKVIWRR